MTIASGTSKIGCAALLVGLVAGCGAEGAGGAAVDSNQEKVVLNEAGYVSVIETADKPGYCGFLELGVDELGNEVVDIERYYYPVINRLLDEDAELKRYTGLSQVSNCDEARSFIRLNNEYQDQKAPSIVDKGTLLAGLPVLPPELPKRDPQVVEKILDGSEEAIEEVIGFGFANDAGQIMNCTGVRLSGTLFLTAAHCLVVQDRPASSPFIITFPRAWAKHVINNDVAGDLYTSDPSLCRNLRPNQKCATLVIDGYMNPNYAGTNDRRNDLAVLHVRNDSQHAVRNTPQAANEFSTSVAFISTVSPALGDVVESVGWGPNGNYDRGLEPDAWFLRTATPTPITTMDGNGPSKANGVYQGTWIGTTAEPGAQLCRGDSGGPTYDEYRHVVGINSRVAGFDTVHTACARNGVGQFMARTDYQVLSFIPIAMNKLQGGDRAKCTCGFFPSAFDPTGKDPEFPGAHVRCNVGCTDPSDWSEL